MRYYDVIQFLEALSKENCAKKRLDITELALSKMHLKNFSSDKVIVVAGTNGKGTTCATLTHLLFATGKNVGLYTSPHLAKINERIKYNLSDISDDEFAEAFEYVYALQIDLSHFEYLTLMACYYFFIKKNVDYAVFEVGLGGTYDATNAIPHDTCIITKLGFDHEKYLGNTLEEIAQNKAGIITNRQTVIHHPFANSAIYEIFNSRAGRLIEACPFEMLVTETIQPQFTIHTKYGSARLALQGKRACENTALALTAFEYLGFNPTNYLNELSNIQWPGRMELVNLDGYNVFLSGDHNEQGIDSLIDILNQYKYKKVHFLVGIANDKNYDAMLSKLESFDNSEIYITETPYKTRAIDDYGTWLQKCKDYDADWYSLFCRIKSIIGPEELLIITGSLYLIGAVKQRIANHLLGMVQ